MNKRLIISVALSVFLIVAVFLTVYLLKQRQELRREAAAGPASLSLLPASGEYNPEETFSINIFLDDGGKKVAGADVSLTFDSEKLSVEAVTPGSLFDDPDTANDEQIVLKNEVVGNKILLSLGSIDPQTGASYFAGSGVYGTVRFLAKELGGASVIIDETPYSKVAEVGGEDILGETSDGSYTIAAAPTPTPTPTPSPTPTPTPTVGPTPTITPTPTPTPTPGPVSGDLNGDGEVNILDFSIFVDYYQEGNLEGDLNDDDNLDILDFSLFVSYYQQAQ